MTSSASLRWEWRAFDRDFTGVHARLATLTPSPLLRADTSIVCRWSNAAAKMSGALLEIRTLQQIDQRGLELWAPLVHADFPIDAQALDTAFRAWRLTAPPAIARVAHPEAFLRRIVTPHTSLAAVNVTAHGRTFTFEHCVVEVAELTFDGFPIETVAVSAADPTIVWRAVEALDLAGHENVSEGEAIKRFVWSPAAEPVLRVAPGRVAAAGEAIVVGSR